MSNPETKKSDTPYTCIIVDHLQTVSSPLYSATPANYVYLLTPMPGGHMVAAMTIFPVADVPDYIKTFPHPRFCELSKFKNTGDEQVLYYDWEDGEWVYYFDTMGPMVESELIPADDNTWDFPSNC